MQTEESTAFYSSSPVVIIIEKKIVRNLNYFGISPSPRPSRPSPTSSNCSSSSSSAADGSYSDSEDIRAAFTKIVPLCHNSSMRNVIRTKAALEQARIVLSDKISRIVVQYNTRGPGNAGARWDDDMFSNLKNEIDAEELTT